MEPEIASQAGIKNNKGKFAVLILFIAVVFGSPLFSLTPFGKASIEGLTENVYAEVDKELFRTFLSELRAGDVESAYARLAPDTREEATLEDLAEVASTLSYTAGNPRVVGGNYKYQEVASASLNGTESAPSRTSTYEVVYSDENVGTTTPYALINLYAQDTGEGLVIQGVHVTPQDRSVEEIISFNWSTHGVYLLLSLLIPALIAFTAFKYIRTSRKPHWGMFLVILLLSVYFTHTGDTWKINVGLNGSFIPGHALMPWIFAIPLPLGVIIYYVRKHLKKRKAPEQVETGSV